MSRPIKCGRDAFDYINSGTYSCCLDLYGWSDDISKPIPRYCPEYVPDVIESQCNSDANFRPCPIGVGAKVPMGIQAGQVLAQRMLRAEQGVR